MADDTPPPAASGGIVNRIRRDPWLILALGIFIAFMAIPFGRDNRFLLSEEGSGRATAYLESPKIISYDGKTHVAWLDTPEEGFRIRVRTLDQDSGDWSDPVTVGEATDNHGGPAMTVDATGHLHLLYYSHHHPFRYRSSVRPNDASEWTEYTEFGHNLTYPALVCAADGTLIMVARRSFDDRPWELEMWTKAPEGEWTRQRSLLRSRHGNYAQFAASLAWGPDHQTLHLSSRIYEAPGEDPMVSLTSVAYLVSDDSGVTWRKADGTEVALPATAETADVIAAADATRGRVLHAGSMAVDAAGVPHLVYGARLHETAKSYLARPDSEGRWRHQYLNSFLPSSYREWDLFMHGGISMGANGQLTLVGTAMLLQPEVHEWGEVSTEIVRFISTDGGESFDANLLGKPNAASPRWMPNIERATGFNEIPDQPSFIYTNGVRGDALHDQLSNEVWWVPGLSR